MNHLEDNANNGTVATATAIADSPQREMPAARIPDPEPDPKPDPPEIAVPNIFSGDLLEKKANDISQAKFEFAASCYYAMLNEGLSITDMFYPLFSNLCDSNCPRQIYKAVNQLVDVCSEHGDFNLNKLKQSMLESAHYERKP